MSYSEPPSVYQAHEDETVFLTFQGVLFIVVHWLASMVDERVCRTYFDVSFRLMIHTPFHTPFVSRRRVAHLRGQLHDGVMDDKCVTHHVLRVVDFFVKRHTQNQKKKSSKNV